VELSNGSLPQLEIFTIFKTEDPAYHCLPIVIPEAEIVTGLSGVG
jgi:hypothetical protein